MKFTIMQNLLRESLAAVTAVVPSRTTHPVLQNVLIEADADGIVFSCTNLDIGLRRRVPAEVIEPGATTVPAKKLLDLARELPAAPITIAAHRGRVELSSGKTTVRLNPISADEFPTFPAISFEGGWTIPGAVLSDMIRRTAFAASTEESRPILNGVLWQIADQEMRMVATDGHRLVRVITPVAAGISTDLIVPARALEQAKGLFANMESVQIARADDKNHIALQAGGTQMYTRLVEGPYPHYEQVIPRDNDKIAVLDVASFVAALRRMAVVASDQTHRVRMSLGPTTRLSVETPDLGEAKEEIDVTYEGEPMDIAFNVKYLLEVLSYIGTERVRMTFKTPERAGTIEPVVDGDGGAADYFALVMPLRLL